VSLLFLFLQFKFGALVLAISAVAVSAFTPNAVPSSPFGVTSGAISTTKLFSDVGLYDGKLWDFAAKKDIYDQWDPTAPRSPTNFNPFETWDGNSPDCSGYYPGEGRYKDPMRVRYD
jgi:hypothetical protein